jgi:hypothetical protein
MAGVVDPITHKFVTVEAAVLNQARAALVDANNERMALQERLGASIAAGDIDGAASLAVEFHAVGPRIEALQAAVEVATSEEDRRLQAARIADQQAKIRGARAHLAQAARFGRSAVVARRDAAQALRSTLDSINSCAALLPEDTIGAFAEIDREAAMQAATALAADETLPTLLAGISNAQSEALKAMAEALPAPPAEQDAA